MRREGIIEMDKKRSVILEGNRNLRGRRPSATGSKHGGRQREAHGKAMAKEGEGNNGEISVL